MHRINSFLFFNFLLFCSFNAAYAQVGQSPLTSYGIGTLNSIGTARNSGMGGVGIGSSHYQYLNSLNPAMLSRNSFYTSFEAGLSIESRTLSNTDLQERTSSGGLDYLSIAFPVMYNRWTLNVGLAPYSTVSYDFLETNQLNGTEETASLRNTGSGGTSRAYIATGARLFKGLSAGLRASYIFGSITHQSLAQPNSSDGMPVSAIARYYSRTFFSDILLTGGLSYTYQLPGKKNQALMAGFTYDLAADLGAERVSQYERIQNSDAPVLGIEDSGVPGSYFLPAKIGAGLSFEKLYHYTLGADISMQNWGDFKNFDGSNENMDNSFRLGLGGEWIPDYSSAKLGTYYKRMTYRMGIQYEKTPFLMNGEEIDDFGITFGLSLPISSASSIHTSFLFGQTGNIDKNLYNERYFRLSLGVTFNDRWFTKIKYD